MLNMSDIKDIIDLYSSGTGLENYQENRIES